MEYVVLIAGYVAAFVGSNLDDLCLLIVFFALCKKQHRPFVVLGEFAGMACLQVLSLLVAMGAMVLLGNKLHLIGVVPIFMAAKAIWDIKGADDKGEEYVPVAKAWPLVVQECVITVVNGADNISLYTPIIAGQTPVQYLVFCGVIVVMTGCWCFVAAKVSKAKAISFIIQKYSKYILPMVFAAVGFSVLLNK